MVIVVRPRMGAPRVCLLSNGSGMRSFSVGTTWMYVCGGWCRDLGMRQRRTLLRWNGVVSWKYEAYVAHQGGVQEGDRTYIHVL